MTALRGRFTDFRSQGADFAPAIVRLSSNSQRPNALRAKEGFLILAAGQDIPLGFGCYLIKHGVDPAGIPSSAAQIFLSDELSYLADGDVISLEPESRKIRVLFRKQSAYNHFLLTERCNNKCLMCSQPPRDVQDGWIVDEILEALPLIDRDAREIGFTGGEPTLLGPRFLELVRAAGSYLPNTALHVLSNGRSFADDRFAEALGKVRHPDLMLGIPLYSDLAHVHDYVVQADGAYDETVRGILNLKRHGVRVEIRVVLQKQTVGRLPELARFISRNLLFVDHVALMGLEITGFARANVEKIWIDPAHYQDELREAVRILSMSGVRTSIYNTQLCILHPDLHSFAKRSISDWKQEYLPACNDCSLKNDCGGFFATSRTRYSEFIRPVLRVAA